MPNRASRATCSTWRGESSDSGSGKAYRLPKQLVGKVAATSALNWWNVLPHNWRRPDSCPAHGSRHRGRRAHGPTICRPGNSVTYRQRNLRPLGRLFLPMAATLLGSSLAACLLMEMWNRAGSRLVLATAFVVAGFVAITALYLEGAAMILAVGAALGQSRPGLLLGAIAMIVATLEVLYGLLLVGSFIWIAVRRRSGGQRAVRNTV